MQNNKTHIKILEKSKKLFACHGFSKTSTSLIAEAVGIKKPSLYYFFKNKEEIYLSILEEIMNDVVELFSKSHQQQESLQQVLEKLLELSKENGPIIFSTASLSDTGMEKITKHSQELATIMKKYLSTQDLLLTDEESLIIILDTSQMYAQRIAHGHFKITPEHYSCILTRLLTH